MSTTFESMKPSLFGTALAAWLQRCTGRSAGRRPVASLHGLDTRTLHDIGLDPSEIASIDAESRGRAPLTRLRIALGGRHA